MARKNPNVCIASPLLLTVTKDHTLNTLPCSRDASVPPFGVYLPQPSPQNSAFPSPAHQIEFSPTRHTSQMSHSTQGANKENVFILQNPLANIFGLHGIAKIIPVPAHSLIKKTDDEPAASNGLSDDKATKKKMHPETYQGKTNGTTDEFCLYWAALTRATGRMES
ncbi:hypothetical protein EV424DRAFT_1347523 [Suillus variegatus]|nr:hypothetical protein EV424DRAFT_1347523 [Suillus variegatus]